VEGRVEEAERGEVVGLVGVSADSFLWMRGRGRSAVMTSARPRLMYPCRDESFCAFTAPYFLACAPKSKQKVRLRCGGAETVAKSL
jgi:hypothetical protein